MAESRHRPGLDINQLRAHLAPVRDEGEIIQRIERHLDSHHGYVAFSGGKDSTVALRLALRADPNVPVAFFDSGLEYPETLRFIDEVTEAWRLNLTVIKAVPDALTLLADSGYWRHGAVPAGQTRDPHEVLIAVPAAKGHALFGRGEIWGVRSSESKGRAMMYARALNTELRTTGCPECTGSSAITRRRHHGGIVARNDGTVAYGPVWDWRDDEIWAYHHRHHLPVNPVYAKLARLGVPERFQRVALMVDANCLEHGRIVWLRRGWPDLYDQIVQVLPRLSEWI